MPRPSRNLDQALLAAGRELFPARGCAGLSIREVADAAGVNLGMFHYHFKSRDAFLRALMQQAYEEMFARLTLELSVHRDAADSLRSAVRAIGRWVRDNRRFIARMIADALGGEQCARDFLRDNLPRHFAVLQALIRQGQAEGRIVELPVPQVIGVCAGAVAMPILFGGALVDGGELPAPLAGSLADALLTDAAIDQRIDLALKAITTQGKKHETRAHAPRPRRAPRGVRQ
jgi:AcrR family transcriptional regulator